MPKIRKKSPILENANANITCDFGDISRFRSRLPHTCTHGHIVSSIIVRYYNTSNHASEMGSYLLFSSIPILQCHQCTQTPNSIPSDKTKTDLPPLRIVFRGTLHKKAGLFPGLPHIIASQNMGVAVMEVINRIAKSR